MWAALAGAVIGGTLTTFGAWAQAAYYRRQRVKALHSALAAEIATCVQIARLNDYEQQFLQMAADIRRSPDSGQVTSMHVPAAHNYFSVFEANAGDIGELKEPLGAQIVCFYQAARAWLDSTSEANIPGSGAANAIEEAYRHEVLAYQIRNLCALGDELVAKLAAPGTSHQIAEAAKVLAPGEIAPILPRSAGI